LAIDAHGNSIYDELKKKAEDRLPAILSELARQRHAASNP
jgi:hypothetical protein